VSFVRMRARRYMRVIYQNTLPCFPHTPISKRNPLVSGISCDGRLAAWSKSVSHRSQTNGSRQEGLNFRMGSLKRLPAVTVLIFQIGIFVFECVRPGALGKLSK
jgi:hypothetical protein